MKNKKFKIMSFLLCYFIGSAPALSQEYKMMFSNFNIIIPDKVNNNDENIEFIPGSPHSLKMNNSEVVVSLNNYPMSNWTFEFWAYMDDWSVSRENTRDSIFTFSEDVSTKPLNIDINMGRLSHYRGEAAGEVMHYNVSNIIGWNHIAITQKRIDAQNVEVKMFLNGNKVDEQTGNYENLGNKIWFGYDGSFENKHWKGELDNIRLWKVTRTESQINSYYNKEIEPTNQDLKGLWLINEKSILVNDSTQNNNDGISNNISFSSN